VVSAICGSACLLSALGSFVIHRAGIAARGSFVSRWINGVHCLKTEELLALLHSPPPRGSYFSCGWWGGEDGEFDRDRQPLVDELGRRGEAAVPLLGAALTDPDPLRRHAAMRALQHIGQPAAAVVYRLTPGLEEDALGRVAAEALWAAGPQGRSALERALTRSSSAPRFKRARDAADWGLRTAGDDAWDYIRPALRSPDPDVRIYAAELSGHMQRNGKSAAQDLTEALGKENDLGATYFMIRALATLGPAARAAAPALLRRTSDRNCARHALLALISITHDAKTYLPPLLQRMRGAPPHEISFYLDDLGSFCRADPEIAPAMAWAR
jgi:HEAT repeat protein